VAPDARFNPAPPPAAGGPPSGRWRLPVRIRVPERDELLAMALATLAVGLVLGLAIGPGLGSAGRILPIISPPLAQIPTSPEVSDGGGGQESTLPVLSAPAGSESTPAPAPALPAPVPVTVAATPVTPDAAPDPVPEEPPATAPRVPQDPSNPGPDPEPAPEGLPVAGTVLAASVNGRSFSLADQSGDLQTIFSDFSPKPGTRIATTVIPLANGTFAEFGGRRNVATRGRVAVRGMVSYIDAELGVLVISNRGTSLPLDGSGVSDELLPPQDSEDPDTPLPLGYGDWVRVKLALVTPETAQSSVSRRTSVAALESSSESLDQETDPVVERPDFGLRIEALERLDETATRIELTGRLIRMDRVAGRLTLSADSVGLLERSIEITTPSTFSFSGVRRGRVYSATVRRTASGELRLTGFSPGYSERAADDRSVVFGEQGF